MKVNYSNSNKHSVLALDKLTLPFRDSKVIVRAETFGVQIQVMLDKANHGKPRPSTAIG
jgi:hypothetical protein